MARSLVPIATLCLVAAACSAPSLAPSQAIQSVPPPSQVAVASTAVATPSTRPPTPSPGPTQRLLDSAFTPGGTAPDGAIEVLMGSCCFLSYEPYKLTAKAGRVEIFLTSFLNKERPYPHDMLIGLELGAPVAASPVLKIGEKGLWVIEDLPAASYVFWCSVNSHYNQGMTGALTVTP